MIDQRKRSFVKAITWRIVMVTTSFTVLFILTEDVKKSVLYTVILNILALLFYYVHERIWERIKFGRNYKK